MCKVFQAPRVPTNLELDRGSQKGNGPSENLREPKERRKGPPVARWPGSPTGAFEELEGGFETPPKTCEKGLQIHSPFLAGGSEKRQVLVVHAFWVKGR